MGDLPLCANILSALLQEVGEGGSRLRTEDEHRRSEAGESINKIPLEYFHDTVFMGVLLIEPRPEAEVKSREKGRREQVFPAGFS